jgi:hypothetical protein
MCKGYLEVVFDATMSMRAIIDLNGDLVPIGKMELEDFLTDTHIRCTECGYLNSYSYSNHNIADDWQILF